MSVAQSTEKLTEIDTPAVADAAPAIEPRNKIRKSPGAFRTISEVADKLEVQQHVLRFWETKFSQIRPLKRGGGRRYYRPEDVALLERIYNLLYTEGYTIKGVQKLLKGQRSVQGAATAPAAPILPLPAKTSETLAKAETTVAKLSRARSTLTDRQRIILESMLGELKELRSLIHE